MKRKALFMCLSDRVKEDNFILLDKFELKEVKTKKVVEALDKLNKKIISKKEDKKDKMPSILIVLDKESDKVFKSAKNINKVSVIGAESLNVVDILKYKYLLTTVQAVESIEKVYGDK